MKEMLTINDRDFWVQIDPHPVERENPNIIPNEYFTAMYYVTNPEDENSIGILMKDEEGSVKLFESPVAALNFASKQLENA